MAHSVILGYEDYICARNAAVAAGKMELASLLDSIWNNGNDLQRKKIPQLQSHEPEETALNNAQAFFVNVCAGNVENREDEAQTILDAINALL